MSARCFSVALEVRLNINKCDKQATETAWGKGIGRGESRGGGGWGFKRSRGRGMRTAQGHGYAAIKKETKQKSVTKIKYKHTHTLPHTHTLTTHPPSVADTTCPGGCASTATAATKKCFGNAQETCQAAAHLLFN